MTKARRRSILNELKLQVEGSLIRKALAASILGAFALAMTPVVVHAADMPKSYKSVKASPPVVSDVSSRCVCVCVCVNVYVCV